MKRREFLGATAAALAARIELRGEPTFQRRLAGRELHRGLSQLGADVSKLTFDLRVEAAGKFPAPEAYSIAAETGRVVFTAGHGQALLYSVYEFLERQGAFFGIDGDVYPIDPPKPLELPPDGRPWTATPRFAVRGLLPWPDFLNCITVYNEEDFRAYFENMLHLRHACLHPGAAVGLAVYLVRVRRRRPHRLPGQHRLEPLGLPPRAHLALRHGRLPVL